MKYKLLFYYSIIIQLFKLLFGEKVSTLTHIIHQLFSSTQQTR